MTNQDLIEIFKIAEKYINPKPKDNDYEGTTNIFEVLDEELARRVSLDVEQGGEASFDASQVSQVLDVIFKHNAGCP